MSKKLLLLGVIVFLVALVTCKSVNTLNLHRPIMVENVPHIRLWSVYGVDRLATEQEVINIINWFDSAKDIRENEEFAGTTEDSGIKVEEKNGSKFSIARSGEDFEVQRKDEQGKLRSYWARQKEIKDLLDKLATKT